MTNNRRQGIGINHIPFLHNDIGALEEGGHGAAQEQGTQDAIEHQEALEGLRTEEITQFILELIAHGLQHEGEEDEHPQPVGATEAGGIEQGEGSEESAAEGDQRGERELPLTTGGIDEQATLVGCLSQLEYHGVGSLHEKQEDE